MKRLAICLAVIVASNVSIFVADPAFAKRPNNLAVKACTPSPPRAYDGTSRPLQIVDLQPSANGPSTETPVTAFELRDDRVNYQVFDDYGNISAIIVPWYTKNAASDSAKTPSTMPTIMYSVEFKDGRSVELPFDSEYPSSIIVHSSKFKVMSSCTSGCMFYIQRQRGQSDKPGPCPRIRDGGPMRALFYNYKGPMQNVFSAPTQEFKFHYVRGFATEKLRTILVSDKLATIKLCNSESVAQNNYMAYARIYPDPIKTDAFKDILLERRKCIIANAKRADIFAKNVNSAYPNSIYISILDLEK